MSKNWTTQWGRVQDSWYNEKENYEKKYRDLIEGVGRERDDKTQAEWIKWIQEHMPHPDPYKNPYKEPWNINDIPWKKPTNPGPLLPYNDEDDEYDYKEPEEEDAKDPTPKKRGRPKGSKNKKKVKKKAPTKVKKPAPKAPEPAPEPPEPIDIPEPPEGIKKIMDDLF